MTIVVFHMAEFPTDIIVKCIEKLFETVQTTDSISSLSISLLSWDLLVYQCPDDSQCVQHQTIHILLLPSWFMGPSPSAWRPDGVPGSAAPHFSGINTSAGTVVHPPSLSSGCPWRAMVMIFQVTILPAHTAVTHGSSAGDHTRKGLPEWTKAVGGGKEEQNPCETPASIKSDPGGYYHIIWRAWFWDILVPEGWVGSAWAIILLPSRDVWLVRD